MTTKLFKKDGETWTRLKIAKSDLWGWKEIFKSKYGIDASNPVKQSDRYVYFEVKGNTL